MLIADRYRLGSVVGQGGMGEVWRATDELLGGPVAVKLMACVHANRSAVARFALEARTAGGFDHPHVVGVRDFGTWEGRPFLVMELVEGGSLADELATGGPLGPERLAEVGAQVAAGLAGAHERGIVHRDIKPGNLLRAADGSVKIADFGIARFVDDPAAALTTTGQIMGTGAYLAPERAEGRSAVPASDVYSLGCVLYQLAVGRPPFQGDTATALLYQHVSARPVPPRDAGAVLPAALEEFLMRMLAKDPSLRPTAAEAAAWFADGAWRTASAPGPLPPENPHGPGAVTAPLAPVGGPALPPAPVRGRPPRGALVGGGIALVAALLTGAALSSSDTPAGSAPVADPSASASPSAPAPGTVPVGSRTTAAPADPPAPAPAPSSFSPERVSPVRTHHAPPAEEPRKPKGKAEKRRGGKAGR
ncbi:serine/threonine-protein kinase [Streptomyces sp. NPDC006339]|uniref:serine/threonine-protein kinase n=1 Tax=Streptomyces sp. NPDC006339 TaxID=3156755 RepID=UPI0033A19B10